MIWVWNVLDPHEKLAASFQGVSKNLLLFIRAAHSGRKDECVRSIPDSRVTCVCLR